MNPTNYHTRELFEKFYSARRPDFYTGVLATLILHGKPGKVLDLGAGLGLFTELAQKWGLNIIGMDGSAFAVEQAKSKGIRMVLHDLDNPLPFEDATVSNILLYQVVEHIANETHKKLLFECNRVLEKDGRIFIFSPSSMNVKEKLEPTHINTMLPSVLRKDLEEAGFQILKQPDSGFWFLRANTGFLDIVSKISMKLFPHDWISSTANAIGIK